MREKDFVTAKWTFVAGLPLAEKCCLQGTVPVLKEFCALDET